MCSAEVPTCYTRLWHDAGIMGISENPWVVGTAKKAVGSPHSRLSLGQNSGVFFSYGKALGIISWHH